MEREKTEEMKRRQQLSETKAQSCSRHHFSHKNNREISPSSLHQIYTVKRYVERTVEYLFWQKLLKKSRRSLDSDQRARRRRPLRSSREYLTKLYFTQVFNRDDGFRLSVDLSKFSLHLLHVYPTVQCLFSVSLVLVQSKSNLGLSVATNNHFSIVFSNN